MAMGILWLRQLGSIGLGSLSNGIKRIHQYISSSVNSLGMNNQGLLPNGVDVAIKRKRNAYHGNRDLEFKTEIQIIPKLQHLNIIKLLGCCIEGGERILVYEYMPRKSLYNIIEELRDGVFLAWSLRYQIIEGIAQGVFYLHQHSRLRMVHGDLKPSNILLDYDMTPKITDFGLAEVLSSEEEEKETISVKGTPGYLDPEFYRTNIISTKTDVYSFGITCLVIMTAQHAIMKTPNRHLVRHAWELWLSGRGMELIDTSLRDDPQIIQILRCMQIALLCVQEKQADRPTMLDVLKMLKCETAALPVPRLQRADMLTRGVRELSADGTTSFRSAELITTDDDEECSSFTRIFNAVAAKK
ncbi:unnamed protein product [Urochloa humidicola]